MTTTQLAFTGPKKRGRSEADDHPQSRGREVKYQKALSTFDVFCEEVCSRNEASQCTPADVKRLVEVQDRWTKFHKYRIVNHFGKIDVPCNYVELLLAFTTFDTIYEVNNEPWYDIQTKFGIDPPPYITDNGKVFGYILRECYWVKKLSERAPNTLPHWVGSWCRESPVSPLELPEPFELAEVEFKALRKLRFPTTLKVFCQKKPRISKVASWIRQNRIEPSRIQKRCVNFVPIVETLIKSRRRSWASVLDDPIVPTTSIDTSKCVNQEIKFDILSKVACPTTHAMSMVPIVSSRSCAIQTQVNGEAVSSTELELQTQVRGQAVSSTGLQRFNEIGRVWLEIRTLTSDRILGEDNTVAPLLSDFLKPTLRIVENFRGPSNKEEMLAAYCDFNLISLFAKGLINLPNSGEETQPEIQTAMALLEYFPQPSEETTCMELLHVFGATVRFVSPVISLADCVWVLDVLWMHIRLIMDEGLMRSTPDSLWMELFVSVTYPATKIIERLEASQFYRLQLVWGLNDLIKWHGELEEQQLQIPSDTRDDVLTGLIRIANFLKLLEGRSKISAAWNTFESQLFAAEHYLKQLQDQDSFMKPLQKLRDLILEFILLKGVDHKYHIGELCELSLLRRAHRDFDTLQAYEQKHVVSDILSVSGSEERFPPKLPAHDCRMKRSFLHQWIEKFRVKRMLHTACSVHGLSRKLCIYCKQYRDHGEEVCPMKSKFEALEYRRQLPSKEPDVLDDPNIENNVECETERDANEDSDDDESIIFELESTREPIFNNDVSLLEHLPKSSYDMLIALPATFSDMEKRDVLRNWLSNPNVIRDFRRDIASLKTKELQIVYRDRLLDVCWMIDHFINCFTIQRQTPPEQSPGPEFSNDLRSYNFDGDQTLWDSFDPHLKDVQAALEKIHRDVAWHNRLGARRKSNKKCAYVNSLQGCLANSCQYSHEHAGLQCDADAKNEICKQGSSCHFVHKLNTVNVRAKKATVKRCRNITIYGWCKNESTFCTFDHSPVVDSKTLPSSGAPSSNSILAQTKSATTTDMDRQDTAPTSKNIPGTEITLKYGKFPKESLVFSPTVSDEVVGKAQGLKGKVSLGPIPSDAIRARHSPISSAATSGTNLFSPATSMNLISQNAATSQLSPPVDAPTGPRNPGRSRNYDNRHKYGHCKDDENHGRRDACVKHGESQKPRTRDSNCGSLRKANHRDDHQGSRQHRHRDFNDGPNPPSNLQSSSIEDKDQEQSHQQLSGNRRKRNHHAVFHDQHEMGHYEDSKLPRQEHVEVESQRPDDFRIKAITNRQLNAQATKNGGYKKKTKNR